MRLIPFIKGLFGSKVRTEELAPLSRKISKALVADPDDYERFFEDDPQGVGASDVNPLNELTDFLTLYQVHPWVYSCTNVIATSVANVPYKLIDADDQELKQDEEICEVICRPNPHQVWYELMETTMTYLELTGNSFWEEVKDDNGRLLALYPLRPDKMKIIPHPKIKIAGYIYEPRPNHQILFAPDDITHIKYQSSNDEYWGVSPAYAAQNPLILDIHATSYNKRFFINSAVPEGVLETDQTISDLTFRRIREQWKKRHGGIKRAFELGILEEGLKYKPISFNQRDMQMAEMKKLSREEILASYRVPPVMVGLLEHANFASSREQRKMFYTDNIFPKLEKIRQIINARLMPGKVKIKYVLEAVNSVIEDIQIQTQVAMSLVSHGIMTINEVRKRIFNMTDVDWGKEPWMPVGLAQPSSHPQTSDGFGDEIGNDPTQRIPEDPQQAENQSTPMGETKPRENKKDDGSGFEKIFAPDPDWTDEQKVQDWNIWNVWKGLATPDFRELRATFSGFFEDQMDRAIPRIKARYKKPKDDKKKKTKKSMAEILVEETYESVYEVYKAAFSNEVEIMLFDLNDENGKLKTKFIPKAKKTIKRHGKFIMGDVGASVSFDVGNQRVADWLKRNAGAQINDINKATRNALGRQLSKALERGEDFDDVLKRIRHVFKGDLSEVRARMIARTETVSLTQFARLEGAIQSGVVKKKRWVTSFVNSRDPHIDMHDTTIPIGKKFKVKNRTGRDLMDGPGDATAKAENVVNCLCTLDFPGSTQEFGDIEGDVPGTRKSIEKGEEKPPVELHVHVEGAKQDVTVAPQPTKVHSHTPVVIKNETKTEVPAPTVINKQGDIHVAPAKVNQPINVQPAKVEQEINVVPAKVENKQGDIHIHKEKEVEKKSKPEKQTKIIVKPTIVVPKQDAPEVKVKVDQTLKMPKRKKHQEVHRDERSGRVIGTTETEETVEE